MSGIARNELSIGERDREVEREMGWDGEFFNALQKKGVSNNCNRSLVVI